MAGSDLAGQPTAADLEAPRPPTGAAALRRVRAIVNPAAGSVGPGAAAELEQLVAEHGLDVEVEAVEPTTLQRALESAMAAAPDLLIVLAGDGTAQAAANLCGPEGPLLAPLPGGTLNMLPHALYGPGDWKASLRRALTEGVETPVSGGEIEGLRFHVAAILGAPALWAEAREAARMGQLQLSWRKARHALARAFSSELSFSLDGGPPQTARALALMCPLVSRAMSSDERALEAVALNPHGALEAFRLGLHTLLSDIIGDWRADPAVETARCRRGRAWATGRIPAILDGEPIRLHKQVEIRFERVSFRALAPPPAVPEA